MRTYSNVLSIVWRTDSVSNNIDEFLAELAALIEPVETHFRWRPQTHDRNDEMVLEAAISGKADALVTYNGSDFLSAGKRFGISVITPSELLKEMTP